MRVLGFAYRVSAAITPISPGYVGVIANRYEVDPGKVHVVPVGVDLDKFKAYVCAKPRLSLYLSWRSLFFD